MTGELGVLVLGLHIVVLGLSGIVLMWLVGEALTVCPLRLGVRLPCIGSLLFRLVIVQLSRSRITFHQRRRRSVTHAR